MGKKEARKEGGGQQGFLSHHRDEEQLEERALIAKKTRRGCRHVSSSTSFFRGRGPETSLVTSFFPRFTRGVRKIPCYL